MRASSRSAAEGEARHERAKRIVISVNTAWNIVNFRLGLIEALRKAGYEVVIMTPSDAYSESFEQLGFAHTPVEIDPTGMSPARDAKLLWSYLRSLRKLRPEAYLGFTVKPNVYGSIAARLLGIPTINNVAGLGTVFVKDTPLTKMVSLLYRAAFRGSTVVFFQNPDDREPFLARKLVRARQARLLPGSGVDLARFTPKGRTRGTADFVFLLVGRLLWDKGLAEYVEAARAIRGDRPDVRFQLLGFVDLPTRNAVARETVEAWQAEGIIEYLGQSDDVRAFLGGADCVVLPSRYREGVPRSLIEAAAMGKPLITTDSPGCREIVRDGINGLLCAPRSAESLIAAMRRMLGLADDERCRMGQAGRALVEERFSEDVVIRAYLDALAEATA